MRVILFNLYPYRAFREARKKRRIFIELSAGVVLGVVVMCGIGSEFADRVTKKESFLGNLSAMEADVAARVHDVQTKKNQLIVLNRQVNALQAVERESILASQWVSYLDGTVPANVSLTHLNVTGNEMLVRGFTDAVSSLAKWIDQMEAGNSLFQSVDLVSVTEPDVVTKGVTEKRHEFEIKALLRGGNDALR